MVVVVEGFNHFTGLIKGYLLILHKVQKLISTSILLLKFFIDKASIDEIIGLNFLFTYFLFNTILPNFIF